MTQFQRETANAIAGFMQRGKEKGLSKVACFEIIERQLESFKKVSIQKVSK